MGNMDMATFMRDVTMNAKSANITTVQINREVDPESMSELERVEAIKKLVEKVHSPPLLVAASQYVNTQLRSVMAKKKEILAIYDK